MNFLVNNRLVLVFIGPFFLGCLSVFSFQPFNLTLINFVIFPTLFWIITYISKKSKNTYRKKPHLINLFYVGYFFGIGFFLTGTYWISNSLNYDQTFRSLIPVTIIILPLALGFFFGVGSLVCGKYVKLDLKSIFIFSASFATVDFLRAKILTGFPWNLWAYSWSWFPEIIQILNPIGLFAFNLITITLFLTPTIFFFKKLKNKIIILGSFFLLFFINYLYGNFVINNNNLETKNLIENQKFINIKIISPNFDLKYNLDKTQISNRVKKLIKYSDIDKNKKTLFVWPEGALSGKYFFEIQDYENLISSNFSDKHLLVFGANTLDQKTEEFYNSFIITDNKLNKKFHYNKIKLVPFGEFLPNIFFLEKFGLKKITEGFGSFSEGKIQKSFAYDKLEIIPLICYEIIFPELIQKIENTNNLIINISEDAWFGNSIGPHQHFAKAIFRAVESDSFVIRSANKGISAIINNKGQIIKSLKHNESGNIESRIPIIEKNKGNKNDLIFIILLITYVLIFLILKKNEK